MNIGALIIGDELLTGKRQDKHFSHLQQVLSQRGLELSWTIIVGDDPIQLERMLTLTMASDDLVFSFGGIGATPDDRTRQIAAKVKRLALTPHPEAIQAIEAQFGESAYPNRVLMGYLPQGSEIIPNPINRVPGFSLAHHHFMPGFPEMAWPMLTWVLDHHYPHLRDRRPIAERSIQIINGRESDLLAVMNQIVTEYPDLLLSSLPTLSAEPYIDFSLRGQEDAVQAAMELMIQAVEKAGLYWSYHHADKK